jgi:hypothetical protein
MPRMLSSSAFSNAFGTAQKSGRKHSANNPLQHSEHPCLALPRQRYSFSAPSTGHANAPWHATASFHLASDYSSSGKLRPRNSSNCSSLRALTDSQIEASPNASQEGLQRCSIIRAQTSDGHEIFLEVVDPPTADGTATCAWQGVLYGMNWSHGASSVTATPLGEQASLFVVSYGGLCVNFGRNSSITCRQGYKWCLLEASV